MSVDWDLLVENHLNKGEKKMSLGLLMESINEVLSEVRTLTGPKFDLRTPLNEEKQVAITFPGLPDIPLTEIGWSKLNTEEGGEIKGAGRTMLEAYLKNVPGKDLSEKIAELDKFYSTGFGQISTKNTSELISKVMAYLVFYKTLTRIITNFNAASAGFTFEAFLATLTDGNQIPANKGTIADYTTGANIPISLKLYAEGSVQTGGSFTDLVNDVVEPKFSHPSGNAMRYVVCAKDLSGQPGEQEGSIKFYQFDITLDNIATIMANASRPHTVQNIMLPLVEVEGGELVLSPDVEDLEPSVTYSDEEIEEKIQETAKTQEWWQNSGLNLTDEQIEAIISGPLVSYSKDQQSPSPLIVLKKGGFASGRTGPAKRNRETIESVLTVGETKPSKEQVVGVLNSLNSVYLKINKELEDFNKKRGAGGQTYKSYQASGLFPSLSKAKGKKAKEENQKVKDRAKLSAEWYNAQDEETKKRALKYTYGYLNTRQFEFNRAESVDGGSILKPTSVGEIKVGSAAINKLLEDVKSVLDESLFDIFTDLKNLTDNLNAYFAGGLANDDLAKSAITAAGNIESSTAEVAGVSNDKKTLEPGAGGTSPQPGGRLNEEQMIEIT